MTKREYIPAKLRHEVFQRDNYRCKECGATNKETTLEIDHIVPVSKGGSNNLSNLQTLCKKCNRAKHTRTWVGGKNTKKFLPYSNNNSVKKPNYILYQQSQLKEFKKCKNCGVINNIGAMKCSNCNHKFTNVFVRRNHVSIKKKSSNISSNKNHLKDFKKCPKCGVVNSIEAEGCSNCTYKFINKIQTTNNELKGLNKHFKRCPNCGTALNHKTKKCVVCNYNFIKKRVDQIKFEEKNSDINKCPKCGVVNNINSEKCSNCYFKFNPTDESHIIKDKSAIKNDENNELSDRLRHLGFKKCPKCGVVNNINLDKCSNCNFNFINKIQTINRESKVSHKNIKKCPYCGTVINHKAKKCVVCNYDFRKDSIYKSAFEKNKIKIKKCPGCGTEIKHDLNYCTTCGIDFNRFKTKNIQELKNLKKCPKCGTVNDFDAKKCIYCNFNINSFIENNNSSEKTASRYKRCPICGTVINRRAKKCIVCNNKFKNLTISLSKKHNLASINTRFKSSEEFMRSIKSDGVFLPCFIPNYYCDEKGNLKIKDNTIIKVFKKVKIYAYGIYVEKIFSSKTLKMDWDEISDIKISSNRLKISMDEKNIILINLPSNINVSDDILNFIPGNTIVNDVREKNTVNNKINIDTLKDNVVISKIKNLFNR